jgi:hypothetical protein
MKKRSFAGQTSEHVLTAFFVCDPRTGHKVLHGTRDQDFARLRSHRYACSDMDRDTTDFVPNHFALTGTQSAAHFEAERSYFVTNTARTANRAGRPIECRKQAVAGAPRTHLPKDLQTSLPDRTRSLPMLCFDPRHDGIGPKRNA